MEQQQAETEALGGQSRSTAGLGAGNRETGGREMIYEPNTTEWPVGALVIHDADAKRQDMLMRVTGRDKATGEYATRYAYPAEQPKQWRRKTWKNDKRYLHDPARFGIEALNV